VAAVLGVAAIILTAETAFAKPKQVKVRVYDAAGRKVAGAEVHVYDSSVPEPERCDCIDDVCKLVPAKSATTGKSGQVRITGLAANTGYTVAVNDSCGYNVGPPCGCKADCKYQPGSSQSFTTNSKGGSSETIELQP
jgi:hypothetical protein